MRESELIVCLSSVCILREIWQMCDVMSDSGVLGGKFDMNLSCHER